MFRPLPELASPEYADRNKLAANWPKRALNAALPDRSGADHSPAELHDPLAGLSEVLLGDFRRGQHALCADHLRLLQADEAEDLLQVAQLEFPGLALRAIGTAAGQHEVQLPAA